MILIWKGWGLLAVVAMFPVLASPLFVFDVQPQWAGVMLVGGLFLVAGAVCVYCGRLWNAYATDHSLYFIPLQVWGWVYATAAGVISLGALIGSFGPRVKESERLGQGIAGGLGFVCTVVTCTFALRAARRQIVREFAEKSAFSDGGRNPTSPWKGNSDRNG